ncbi:MAG: hypothetical protein BWK79_05355 [Beggiatoa sp. IS2]|nr:MAG: hypothetical protein BWK79_05355 [Beggiatoa sp. IS2]
MKKQKRQFLGKEAKYLFDAKGNWASFLGKFEPQSVKLDGRLADILPITPYTDKYVWGGGGHSSYRKVFAISFDESASYADEFCSKEYFANGSGEKYETNAECVVNQLSSFKNTSILVEVEFDSPEQGDYTKSVTIYHINFLDIKKELKRLIDSAYAELLAELENSITS